MGLELLTPGRGNTYGHLVSINWDTGPSSRCEIHRSSSEINPNVCPLVWTFWVAPELVFWRSNVNIMGSASILQWFQIGWSNPQDDFGWGPHSAIYSQSTINVDSPWCWSAGCVRHEVAQTGWWQGSQRVVQTDCIFDLLSNLGFPSLGHVWHCVTYSFCNWLEPRVWLSCFLFCMCWSFSRN